MLMISEIAWSASVAWLQAVAIALDFAPGLLPGLHVDRDDERCGGRHRSTPCGAVEQERPGGKDERP
jgi:hypothetical protein